MSPEQPRYRLDRPRPERDLCGGVGRLALQDRQPYALTEHDAQFAAYTGNPVVQADIAVSGYAHEPETVDLPE